MDVFTLALAKSMSGNQYVFPQQFGAAGDGQTDDTQALSIAMNRSNAVIEGSNRSYKLTEIVLNECSNLLICNFRFYHGIQIKLKHCENITFQNCIWDEFQDNGIEGKTVHCVVLSTIHTGSDEWTEANNWRINEVCKNITFERCQFLGTHYSESTPSLYENNKPHYNTGMCMRLEGIDGLKVVGCYFTQNRGNACIQHNCYAPLGDFEITDNFFYLNCWGGIELYRYTGISSYPTRVIQGNRFIGHGLGYLPWEYLERFDEKKRGVGTAVLLGGHTGRIQNEPADCAVYNNIFIDNNESAVEGWQWNPVKNNIIIGNGVLQSPESVTEMAAKYKITYPLYVRKNPSQNPIYIGQYSDVQRYMDGEARVVENNTIGRMYGTKNPIVIRGYFYEPVIFRNNTMTDAALYTDENSKFAHFLSVTFYQGLVWENNIGMKPYFNACTFAGGEYHLDELFDVYNCTFTSQKFESVSKIDRFQKIKTGRFSDEYASLRDNRVSNVVNGKPVLGYYKKPVSVEVPTPFWSIKDQLGYTNGSYTFGGVDNPTVLDTNLNIGETDKDWTIYVDTTTLGDNDAGNNSWLITLLTIADNSNNISLQLGSRYSNQLYTWIFPNGYWGYDTTYRLDGSQSMAYLGINRSTKFVLRHKQASGQIDIYAVHPNTQVSALSEIKCGSYPFTSGTAGTLRFGGSIMNNTDRPKAYYNGVMSDASVFNSALSDAEVSMLMLGVDVSSHGNTTPVYDIKDEENYVDGTGLVMDGTFAIDTNIPLLENTRDFTIIARFKFDNITQGGTTRPNFTFIPVFSAMSAEMAEDAHYGHDDKGFDLGLTMQNGVDMNGTAKGGFICFRRDWRYLNKVNIDTYNYNNYFNIYYTIIIQRKNNVIRLYNNNLVELGKLTGDYATSIINGNLTIGAKMGYDSSYTDFFKGIIDIFEVYDNAISLDEIELRFPSISDNEVSEKGAVTYHLTNNSNTKRSARYALVEINYDLGEYNSAEYTAQYPKAFGVRLDDIYEDVIWVPCSSSKRIIFHKICKWSATYNPYESWDMEIINPGMVPNMNVTINGVKALLLSKQEAVPNTVDAVDFNVSWDAELDSLIVGNEINGYVQYVPEEAVTGLTLTASSEDEEIATVSVFGQNVIITGVAAGDTLIHVSIPYGTEYIYEVVVSDN